MEIKKEKPQQVTPDLSSQAYLHTPQAGAVVPLLQAVITGFLIGFGVLIILLKLRAQDAWFYGGLIWVLVTTVTWVLLQGHWYWLTMFVERITGLDLNQDGAVGAPVKKEPSEVRIRLSQVRNGGYSEMVLSLPASCEQLLALANGIVNEKRPFTVREWTGKNPDTKEENPFSQEEFKAVRSALLRARTFEGEKLLVPSSEKSNNVGFEFTEAGIQVLTEFLKEASV